MALQASKKLLRKELKTILKNLSPDVKKYQSAAITKKVLANPFYQKSNRVGIFLSTPDEVDTDEIVVNILSSGKECFIPRCTDEVMDLVKVRSMEDFDKLPVNKWGIREPAIDEDRLSCLSTGGLDLVIVPGLGFTLTGKRLGKGKGYYDKFLAELSKHSNFSTIGLTFNEQIMNEIPTSDHDFTVDVVITENSHV